MGSGRHQRKQGEKGKQRPGQTTFIHPLGVPAAVDARSNESPSQVDGQNGREGVYHGSDVGRELTNPDDFHAHARETGSEQQGEKGTLSG